MAQPSAGLALTRTAAGPGSAAASARCWQRVEPRPNWEVGATLTGWCHSTWPGSCPGGNGYQRPASRVTFRFARRALRPGDGWSSIRFWQDGDAALPARKNLRPTAPAFDDEVPRTGPRSAYLGHENVARSTGRLDGDPHWIALTASAGHCPDGVAHVTGGWRRGKCEATGSRRALVSVHVQNRPSGECSENELVQPVPARRSPANRKLVRVAPVLEMRRGGVVS